MDTETDTHTSKASTITLANEAFAQRLLKKIWYILQAFKSHFTCIINGDTRLTREVYRPIYKLHINTSLHSTYSTCRTILHSLIPGCTTGEPYGEWGSLPCSRGSD